MAYIQLEGRLDASEETLASPHGPKIDEDYIVDAIIDTFGACLEWRDFRAADLKDKVITIRSDYENGRKHKVYRLECMYGYVQTADCGYGPIVPDSLAQFITHQVDVFALLAGLDGRYVRMLVRDTAPLDKHVRDNVPT